MSGAHGFGATPPLDGVTSFVGSKDLQGQVLRVGNQRLGTKYPIHALGRFLGDEVPIDVTFSNEVASRRDVELLSLRHPLVRAAVRYFKDRPDGIARFASVSVPSTQAAGRWLVGFYVASTTGVHPQLEIWPIAVELGSSRVDESVGDLLLGALAEGKLSDGPLLERRDLKAAYDVMVVAASRMHHQAEAKRRASNAALADARIASHEATFRYKIERIEQMLRDDTGIASIHRGRIRNLEGQRVSAIDELEGRKALAMSLRLEAMAGVTFTAEGKR